MRGRSKAGKTVFTVKDHAAIQGAVSLANGATISAPSKAAGGYGKNLFSNPFASTKATIASMRFAHAADGQQTELEVHIVNRHGEPVDPCIRILAKITSDNARATGESIALLMTTKKQHGEYCADQLEGWVAEEGSPAIVFKVVAGKIVATKEAEGE